MIRTAEQYNEAYSRLITMDNLEREFTEEEHIEYAILSHLVDEYQEQQKRSVQAS